MAISGNGTSVINSDTDIAARYHDGTSMIRAIAVDQKCDVTREIRTSDFEIGIEGQKRGERREKRARKKGHFTTRYCATMPTKERPIERKR